MLNINSMRVHLGFDIPASNRWQAIERVWEAIQDGMYKDYFAYHFVEKEKVEKEKPASGEKEKPVEAWLTTARKQLFGK